MFPQTSVILFWRKEWSTLDLTPSFQPVGRMPPLFAWTMSHLTLALPQTMRQLTPPSWTMSHLTLALPQTMSQLTPPSWTMNHLTLSMIIRSRMTGDHGRYCHVMLMGGCLVYIYSSWDSGNNVLVVAQPFDYEDVASYPDFPNATICK